MKMVSKVVDEGFLTINEDRKRFHILAIAKDKRIIKSCKKLINKMKNKGYELVPFENCCEPGDEIEIHDKNGTVKKRGFSGIGFGETSLYSNLKRQGLNDDEILRKCLEMRGMKITNKLEEQK